MLDVRYSHLYFYRSLNRLQRGLSAIAELLVNKVSVETAQVSFYHSFQGGPIMGRCAERATAYK